MNQKSFISGCKSLGYEVKVEYVKTSYISDYKAGNFSNSVGTGSIAVYTISDGMGGEIKIADANGNGGLETEELFMNNILGDVMKDISIPTNNNVAAQSVSPSSNSAQSVFENKNATNTIETKKEEKVSQDEFNNKVEEYLKKGYSEQIAILKAKTELNVMAMMYTGTMETEEAKA